MSVHIDAKPGDVAESILLPGDPLRAKWIADTFLENVVCYNEFKVPLNRQSHSFLNTCNYFTFLTCGGVVYTSPIFLITLSALFDLAFIGNLLSSVTRT